jgi:hypothetical protein
MNDVEVNIDIDIDNNYISMMNQIITIDDMIENLYYRTDIAWSKNVKCINLLYLNGLKETSTLSLNTLITERLNEAVKLANEKRPIFKYIDYDLCNKYNLYTIGYKKSSRNENNIIPVKIFDNPNINIDEIVSNLEPLYSTLKYKIKEERITRNLRNDLNDFKKVQYMNFIKLSNDIRQLKKIIRIQDEKENDYNNEITYMKIVIYFLSIGLVVNFSILGIMIF